MNWFFHRNLTVRWRYSSNRISKIQLVQLNKPFELITFIQVLNSGNLECICSVEWIKQESRSKNELF